VKKFHHACAVEIEQIDFRINVGHGFLFETQRGQSSVAAKK